jgi:hypothetical protein
MSWDAKDADEKFKDLSARGIITDEKISSHSFLNKYECELAGKEIRRLLAHEAGGGEPLLTLALETLTNFIGGGLLTGGSGKRDGFVAHVNYKIWLFLIERLNKEAGIRGSSEEIKALLNRIEGGLRQLEAHAKMMHDLPQSTEPQELLKIAREEAEQILQLEQGQSLLLHGGWLHRSGPGGGHAQVFEIIRRDEESIDLLIHVSTGTCQEEHFAFGIKRRQIPLIRYVGIPLETFLIQAAGETFPLFLQGLAEIQTIASKTSEQVVKQEHLLHLCAPFEKYRVDVPVAETGAITGQRGGTCTASATKVWIRHSAKSMGVAKPLQFCLNFDLLHLLYLAVEKDLGSDSLAARELRQAFLLETENLYAAPPIPCKALRLESR